MLHEEVDLVVIIGSEAKASNARPIQFGFLFLFLSFLVSLNGMILEHVDGVLISILEEETTDGWPDDTSDDHFHEHRRDGVVGPGYDALVDLQPVIIVPHGCGVDGAFDVVHDAKYVEDGVVESRPHREVGVASLGSQVYERRC